MVEHKQKEFYQLSTEDSLRELKTIDKGLSKSEAERRLIFYGSNSLASLKTESWLHAYLRQFKDSIVLLLVASAGLTFYLGDARTTTVLIVIVLLNTAIGFLQEYKAEKIMKSLEKLTSRTAQVFRDNHLSEENASRLVPGDIVRITEGESVPADLRIIEETNLSTNDFALTGESNPSRKFTHAIHGESELGSRHNLAFMGTTVAAGEAYAVVMATGMNTELGRIAALSHAASHTSSPLQREMNNIAAHVTLGVVLLCAVILPLIIQDGHVSFKEAFLFAIGFASSLIPQGMPAEINTALAQAARKLARAKVIVKKLSAVETLGATHIICTDKTGTLTKNQMTVEQIIIGRTHLVVNGAGYEANGFISDAHGYTLTTQELRQYQQFFACGVYANNAKVLAPDDEHNVWYCLGDPTEGALLTLARKAGIDTETLGITAPEIKQFGFDSARKRMSSIRNVDETTTVYVKGSPESVIERSTHVLIDGVKRSLTNEDRAWYLKQHENLARSAMRNIAYATKTITTQHAKSTTLEEAESELTLLGMVSMIDPLREEVPEAMRAAERAHIRVNIVTGDYALTAEAIANKAGLSGKDEHLVVITGEELTQLSDKEILDHVRQGGTIFSRVSPEDKMRIVDIIKNAGEIVAVTGDGINDAPALKRADIGVAMGLTGTDVAKQASEIVLMDDSFNTLVHAIKDGRTIYANIKKGVLSCFTSNFAELFTNLFSLIALTALGVPLAISVLQILVIDLVAELFPIAALGWDKAEGELMHEQPRRPSEHIMNLHSILDLAWCGVVIGTLAFGNYLLSIYRGGSSPLDLSTESVVYLHATTMTYVTIVVCQLINIIQRRSVKGFFTRYQLSNRYFWGAIALSLICTAAIVYVPVISMYFGTAPLSFIDLFIVTVAGVIFLAIRELQRLVAHHVTA